MSAISIVGSIIAVSMMLVGGYTVWNGLKLSHNIGKPKKA